MANLQAALEWAKNNPNDERSRKLLDAVSTGKITTDSVQAKQIQQETKDPGATTGIFDAVKKGFIGAKEAIVSSGNELANVLATPTSDMAGQFAKTAKASTALIKAPIKVASELAIATPLRVVGEVAENVTGFDVNEAVSQGAQRLIQKGIDTETAQKAMTKWAELKETDPESAMALGAVMDIADIAANVAGLGAEKVAATAVKQGLEKTAIKGAEIAGEQAAKIGNIAAKTGEYGAAQTFGFNPETVRTIIKNPEFFTPEEMAKIDRESVFTKVKNSVDKKLDELSDTGKEYDAIKKLDVKARVSENTITDLLKSKGIQFEDGKLKVDLGSDIQLSAADSKGLEEVLGLIKGKTELSAKEVLNLRSRLSTLSKFGEGKTDASKLIAKEIRSRVDAIAKKEIPGLADLDARFAPEIKRMKNIKKIIFNSDGTVKDSAISRIANLTGKGKEQLLVKIEQIIPGITKDVNILKAIEDVNVASGQKVGTYMRTVAGAGTGALAGGPVGAIIGAILTSPQMGIKILRAYAKYKNIPSNKINGMINKMQSGKKLIDNEVQIMNEAVDNAAKKAGDRLNNIRPGMSIEDVSKKGEGAIPKIAKVETPIQGGKYIPKIQSLKTDEKNTFSDFTDYVAGSYKPSLSEAKELKADVLASMKRIGMKIPQTDKGIASAISKILEKINFKRK